MTCLLAIILLCSTISSMAAVTGDTFTTTGMISNYLRAVNERCMATVYLYDTNGLPVYHVAPVEYASTLYTMNGMTSSVVTGANYVATNWYPVYVTNRVTNFVGAHIDADLLRALDDKLTHELLIGWMSRFVPTNYFLDGTCEDYLATPIIVTNGGNISTSYPSSLEYITPELIFSNAGVGLVETQYSFGLKLTRETFSSVPYETTRTLVEGVGYPTLVSISGTETTDYDGVYKLVASNEIYYSGPAGHILFSDDGYFQTYYGFTRYWQIGDDGDDWFTAPYWSWSASFFPDQSSPFESFIVGVSNVLSVTRSNSPLSIYWIPREEYPGTPISTDRFPVLLISVSNGSIPSAEITLYGSSWVMSTGTFAWITNESSTVQIAGDTTPLSNRWIAVTSIVCSAEFDASNVYAWLGYTNAPRSADDLSWYIPRSYFAERFAVLSQLVYVIEPTPSAQIETFISRPHSSACISGEPSRDPCTLDWDYTPDWASSGITNTYYSGWFSCEARKGFDNADDGEDVYAYSTFSGVKARRQKYKPYVVSDTNTSISVQFYVWREPIAIETSCGVFSYSYSGGRSDYYTLLTAFGPESNSHVYSPSWFDDDIDLVELLPLVGCSANYWGTGNLYTNCRIPQVIDSSYFTICLKGIDAATRIFAVKRLSAGD